MALVFSPDGKQVATYGWEGPVRLWDLATASLVRSFGDAAVQGVLKLYQVAFSPDGRFLVTAGADDDKKDKGKKQRVADKRHKKDKPDEDETPRFTGDLGALKDAIDLSRQGKTSDATAAEKSASSNGPTTASVLVRPSTCLATSRTSSWVIASMGHVSSHVLHRMQISGSIRCCRMISALAAVVMARRRFC